MSDNRGSIYVRETLLHRSKVLTSLRKFLDEMSFIELTTPVVRGDDDGFRPRPEVELHGTHYLREAIGPALRLNLQHFPRVYEVGPCFRSDAASETHSPEFSMLDFYAAGEDLDFLMETAETAIAQTYDGRIERVSISDEIQTNFGVSPFVDTEEAVRMAMVKALRLPKFTSTYQAVEEFVERTIEPRSMGGCLLLHEFPLGTEVCARLRPGTTAVLDRFEILMNGLEVVHGYQDETNAPAYIERASEIYFYNEEQAQVQNAIASGSLPAESVGLGIGIERLCMATLGSSDIGEFLASTSVR